MPFKLYKYILNKFVSTFAAAGAVFTVLFLMDQASWKVEQLALQASTFQDFLISFLLLAPPLLAYTIPIAFLMAMVWTLEQMKQDRELLAIMASGFAPLRLLTPFVFISVIVFITAYYVTGHTGPASFRKYYSRLGTMARQSFINDLKPGIIFNGIPGTLLLVGGFDKESGRMDGIILIHSGQEEHEKGEIILARSGRIQASSSEKNDLVISMEDGTLHPVTSAQEDYSSGSFKSLLSRARNQSTGPGVKTKDLLMALSNTELQALSGDIEDATDQRQAAMYIVEYNRRTVFPLTILLYPFIIFPVAVTTGRHGKIVAFTGSLLLFILTFMLFSIGARLAYQGIVPAAVGAWLPAIFLFAMDLVVFPAYAAGQLRGLRKQEASAP